MSLNSKDLKNDVVENLESSGFDFSKMPDHIAYEQNDNGTVKINDNNVPVIKQQYNEPAVELMMGSISDGVVDNIKEKMILNDISNIDISDIENKSVIVWNSDSKTWENEKLKLENSDDVELTNVIVEGSILRYINGKWRNSLFRIRGGDTNEFINLIDTPVSYCGSGGYFLTVTSSEDAVEFVEGNIEGWTSAYNHSLITSGNPHDVSFLELTDTSGSYSGEAGKGLKVNSNENGIEFYTISGSGVDEQVKVSSGATAGYLGSNYNDGVLRITNQFSYVDGGDYITLGINSISGLDHGSLSGLSDDDHTQYLLADGTRELTGDWDIGDGRYIATDKIRARDNEGLSLFNSSGSGIFVSSGDNVNIGIENLDPRHKLVVGDILTSGNNSSLFSVDQMTLSQLEGGAYFGNTHISENQWKNSNHGNNWVAKDSSRNWEDVAMSSDGKFQTAVIYNGQIYVSIDYGNTWTAMDSSRNWTDIAMSSDGKIQTAVVDGGQIYVSIDYGNTWVAKDSSRNWYSVAMSSDGKIQTVIDNSTTIYVSYDYGETWTTKGTSENWNDVIMSSDGKIQTATGDYIFISHDYGQTWTQKGINGYWIDVAMSSDGKFQTAMIGGGYIYRSDDYGITWTQVGSSLNWYGIAMTTNGKIQIGVAWSEQIYKSTDYGVTWSVISNSSSLNWYGIAMSSDGKLITSIVYAGQIYVSNSDSYVYGKVGIGILFPTVELDVDGYVKLSSGTSVNEFSIDGTLSGNSDNTLSTEQAIKTYVDNSISGLDHGSLSGLSDDDHTQYLLANGTRELTGDWDIGDGRYIATDKIRARDNDGLSLFNSNGNGIFVSSDDFVGMGTTSPVAPEHIHYQVTGSGNYNNQSAGILLSRFVNGNDYRSSSIFHSYRAGDFEYMAFAVSKSSTGSAWSASHVKMVLGEDGYMGLGTIEATNKLHMDNGTGNNNFLQFTNGSTTGQTSTDGTIIGTVGSNKDFLIFQQESAQVYFGTNNITRMIINSAGNVGLNTNPSLGWSGIDALLEFKGLDIGGNELTNSIVTDQTAMYIVNNAYYDGSDWKSQVTGGSWHNRISMFSTWCSMEALSDSVAADGIIDWDDSNKLIVDSSLGTVINYNEEYYNTSIMLSGSNTPAVFVNGLTGFVGIKTHTNGNWNTTINTVLEFDSTSNFNPSFYTDAGNFKTNYNVYNDGADKFATSGFHAWQTAINDTTYRIQHSSSAGTADVGIVWKHRMLLTQSDTVLNGEQLDINHSIYGSNTIPVIKVDGGESSCEIESNSNNNAALQVKQTGGGNIFTLFDDENEVVSVIDGGIVGINKSTPIGARLEVVGIADEYAAIFRNTVSESYGVLITAGSSASDDYSIRIMDDSGVDDIFNVRSTGKIYAPNMGYIENPSEGTYQYVCWLISAGEMFREVLV